MYLDEIAALIRANVPEDRIPQGDADELFRSYAVLLRAKGDAVTQSDIHDAWAAWMAKRNPSHVSLVGYDDLPPDVRDEDRAFATAIHRAASQLRERDGSRPSFAEVLFPTGPPRSELESQQALDLYKVMVESSESLVNRRQVVNTFFLTMNGALFTAIGLIVQSSSAQRMAALGVAVLAIAGVILCLAWRTLIKSFGQLNRGKFKVINALERYLKAAIYAAEWEALGRGEDPKVYRSFTSREVWVPNALVFLHGLAALVALLVACGAIVLGGAGGAA